MIFQYSWEKVLTGEKTQTRRLALPEADGTGTFQCEMLSYPDGKLAVCRYNPNIPEAGWRKRWQVGQQLAVQSGRTQRGLWFKRDKIGITVCDSSGIRDITGNSTGLVYNERNIPLDWLAQRRFIPARIEITGIRREDVRNISDEDSKAEGFEDWEHFMGIWTSMYDHDKEFNSQDLWARGGQMLRSVLARRPAEKYQAWVLTFKLVEG